MSAAPPLTEKTREAVAAIEAAERAAHEIGAHVERAVALLLAPMLTGSQGLVDPRSVEANLQEARAAIGKAITLLGSTKWPSRREAA